MRSGTRISITLFQVIVVCFFQTLSACNSKIFNNRNDLSEICGIAPETIKPHASYLVFHSSKFDQLQSRDLEVYSLPEYLEIELTPKACLVVDASLKTDRVIVKRRLASEGKIIQITDMKESRSGARVINLTLEAHDYRPLSQTCMMPSHLNQDVFSFPWQSTRSPASYQVEMKVYESGSGNRVFQKSWPKLTHTQEDLHIELTSLKEGPHQATLLVKELFSLAQTEYELNCEITVDRTSPKIDLLVDSRARFDFQDEVYVAFSPGEIVRFNVQDNFELQSVYTCLRRKSSEDEVCEYQQSNDGTVTIPNTGTWVLEAYGQDRAGNISNKIQINFVSLNQSAVDRVDSTLIAADALREAGRGLEAIQKSVFAYSLFQELGTEIEKDILRSRIVETMLRFAPNYTLVESYHESSIDFSHRRSFEGWHGDNILEKFVSEDSSFLRYVEGENEWLHSPENINGIENFNLAKICQGSADRILVKNSDHFVVFDLKSGLIKLQSPQFDGLLIEEFRSFRCEIVLGEYRLERGEPLKSVVWFPGRSSEFVLLDGKYDFKVIESDNGPDLVWLDSERNELKHFAQNQVNQTYQKTDIFDYYEGVALESVSEIIDVSPCSSHIAIRKTNGSTEILDKNLETIITKQEPIKAVYFSSGCETVSMVVSEAFETYSLSNHSRISSFWFGPHLARDISVGSNLIAATFSLSNSPSSEVRIWTVGGQIKETLYLRDAGFSELNLSSKDRLAVRTLAGVRIFDLTPAVLGSSTSYGGVMNGLKAVDDNYYLHKYYQIDRESTSPSRFFETLVLSNLETNEDLAIDLPVIETYDSIPVPGIISLTNTIYNLPESSNYQVAVQVNRGTLRFYEDIVRDSDKYRDVFVSDKWLLDVAFHSNNRYLAASSFDGNVYLSDGKDTFTFFAVKALYGVGDWDTTTYPGHVQFIEEEDALVVSDSKGYLHRFSNISEALENLRVFATPDRTVQAHSNNMRMTTNADASMIVTTSYDGWIRVWNSGLELLDEVAIEKRTDVDPLGVSLVLSDDGSQVFVGSYDGSWNSYDLNRKTLTKVLFSQPYFGAKLIEYMPGESPRLLTSDGSRVLVWDLDLDVYKEKACRIISQRSHLLPNLSDEEKMACGL